MIVLFAVLLALPQDRLRGAVVGRSRERFRVPTVRSAAAAGGALVIVVVLLRGIMAPAAVAELGFGLTFSIIALSLVLLTGYGGQINLAALSFGAVGTLVVFHFGMHGAGLATRTTLLGFLLAGVVCAAVGALVALPAVRLRGLYLALATMAFGVFVSRMVLTEIGPRKLPLIHTRFTVFPQGNLVVGRPKIGPLDFHADRTYLVLVAVVFAVLAVGLVGLRNSGYGRRLAGLRDSPVGSATLGLSVARLKLSAFMASAAIAGIGGALMAAQLGSVNLDRFDIFLSLSLLMLTVVCGIGYVTGALFGGLLAAVAFPALQATLVKVGTDHASVHGVVHFLASATLVLPAVIGVSLGRNPTGAVDGVVNAWRSVRNGRGIGAVAIAAEGGAYALRRAGVISNWWLVAATTIVVVGVVLAGAGRSALERARSRNDPLVDLELIGIDRPFSVADRKWLDRDLGIEAEVSAHGAA
jgi:branched-chain amino acid transport system permease protein